jgi:hypothetical protein
MKVDAALQYAEALKAAARNAARAGRDELIAEDLQGVVDLDDAARDELEAAIKRSEGSQG